MASSGEEKVSWPGDCARAGNGAQKITVAAAAKQESHAIRLKEFILFRNSHAFIAHLPDDADAKAPAAIAAAVEQSVALPGDSSADGFELRVLALRAD